MNFLRGLLQRRQRTGVEPLNLAIIHLHYAADILRRVAVCNNILIRVTLKLYNV